MILKVTALTLFMLVPGWLAVSLLAGEKKLGGQERLFLAAATGPGIVFLCSLALALASSYSLLALLLMVGGLCLALLAVARRRIAWPARLKRSELLSALFVIVVALVLSVPPGRTVFGWTDVGMYADIAANIERTGAITMQSRAVREVAPERRFLVYKPQTDPTERFLAYENKTFLITDFEKGMINPTFFYLWPAALTVFASFLGVGMQFWAVTAMAVMALWGFLLLALRLLGRRWGWVAFLLLALSPLYAYFSRYGTSEIMSMGLFVAASLCLTICLDRKGCGTEGGSRGLAVTSAFFFTLGFLCRIDFLVVLAPFFLFYLGRRVNGTMTADDGWLFSLTFGGAALATFIALRFSAPYFHSVFGYLADDLGGKTIFLGSGSALAVLAFIFAPRLKGLALFARKGRKIWMTALWLCLAGIFAYLYFIRPGAGSSEVAYGVINPTRGPSYISQTLVRWAWYLSFPGLMATFSGYALWFSRRRDSAALPVAMIGLVLTLGYSVNMRCTPLHILTMRRLVPVILPVAALVMSYCLQSLLDAGAGMARARRWGEIAGKLAAGALLFYLVLYAVNASVPIYGLEEGGNQLELTGEIAEIIDDGGVVLMDYHLGDLFGPPLRCFHGVEEAWLMDNSNLADEEIKGLLSDLGFPRNAVYLLWRPGMSGYHIPIADGLSVEEAGRFVSWEETLEKSFERRPGSRRYYSEEILLFRITSAGRAP
ncbi:MAG: hypothetical protein QME88_11155 [Actinomycetota bacterium]|nr:hypothetical protein [Actinomycetota bacterium]